MVKPRDLRIGGDSSRVGRSVRGFQRRNWSCLWGGAVDWGVRCLTSSRYETNPFVPLPEPIDSEDFEDFNAQDEREATERDEDEFGMGRGW